MKSWSVRQMLVLLLTVLVTMGLGSSVVQASGMATKMAMASDMGASGHGDCGACPAGGKDGSKAMACSLACAPLIAMPSHGASAPSLRLTPAVFMVRHQLLHGLTSPPDPFPPRTTDIG
ncbi:hypothetical protein EOA31_29805 [Mesorhizobium sp. M4B.F.Ca.ET.049.02.1.2]|nr:hypothetical protein EOA31_29805 [Mesorhizobium sp. M4B.F.Ca.ET.049.02.1.2]